MAQARTLVAAGSLGCLALAGLLAGEVAPGAVDRPSAAQSPTARLVRVGTFSAPVFLAAPPGDRNRVMVVERGGRIRLLRGGRKLRTPFLDISGSVLSGGERGLLSMAFAPDYSRSRRFYVYFTDNRGDIRVQEFRRSRRTADRADRGTRRDVLRQGHRRFSNHNGGQLQFGPDGLLYAGLGDGGGGGDTLRSGQDLGTLLGKLLRIDPRPASGRRYRIPRSNPFRRRSGARAEIYSYGLRNPWRFSFDRATGDLAIGDVGQNRVEEIDFVRRGRGRGANFGWNRFEGTRRVAPGSAPGHVPPVLEKPNPPYCAIIGGYVVRDAGLDSLRGRYVYGDSCHSDVRSVRLETGRASGDRSVGIRVGNLSSFGEDARGRVYALSLSGPVYRLASR